jgi:hypothetical protein
MLPSYLHVDHVNEPSRSFPVCTQSPSNVPYLLSYPLQLVEQPQLTPSRSITTQTHLLPEAQATN